jgi:hypothetical protein
MKIERNKNKEDEKEKYSVKQTFAVSYNNNDVSYGWQL